MRAFCVLQDGSTDDTDVDMSMARFEMLMDRRYVETAFCWLIHMCRRAMLLFTSAWAQPYPALFLLQADPAELCAAAAEPA